MVHVTSGLWPKVADSSGEPSPSLLEIFASDILDFHTPSMWELIFLGLWAGKKRHLQYIFSAKRASDFCLMGISFLQGTRLPTLRSTWSKSSNPILLTATLILNFKTNLCLGFLFVSTLKDSSIQRPSKVFRTKTLSFPKRYFIVLVYTFRGEQNGREEKRKSRFMELVTDSWMI